MQGDEIDAIGVSEAGRTAGVGPMAEVTDTTSATGAPAAAVESVEAATPSPQPPSPETAIPFASTVVMYAQNGAGLGHIRRCTNIAAAVVAGGAERNVVIASRSLVAASAFPLPERCDILKLPVFARLGDDASGERRMLGEPEDPAFARLRSRLLVDVVSEIRPVAVLVDNEPRGLGGEMVEALKAARRDGLVGRIVCGLRDIRGRSEYVVQKWQQDGTARVLSELYDLALVYGDPAVFDTRTAYGLGTEIPIEVAETGYLFNGEPAIGRAMVREAFGVPASDAIVAVTVGSGADGLPLLELFVDEVVPRMPSDVVSVVLAGPMMPATEFERLVSRASERCRVVRQYDALSLVAAADAVICQGGYNTMCEAVHVGHRPLVVPRLTRSGEQETRATMFSRLGLCEVIRPDEADAMRIARSIDRQLDAPLATSPFRPAESAAAAARALLS